MKDLRRRVERLERNLEGKRSEDSQGELVNRGLTKTHVKRLSPPWAYELVLGKPQTELDSLKNLAEAGWISDQVISQALARFESFEGDMKRIVGGNNKQV